jgi:DNA-binding NarL/FixJ family response regulator
MEIQQPNGSVGGTRKIRVVVVDDHLVTRQGIQALLYCTPDIEVVGEAEDGHEAIKIVAEMIPHVVLMDIAMPVLNGIEAARQIIRSNPSVRIVFLSQYSDGEHVKSVMASGATGYLTKRAGIADIVYAIQEAYMGRTVLDQEVSAKLFIEYQRLLTNGMPITVKGNELTPREMETLQLVAEGYPNKGIAVKLNISVKTVEKHRQQVMNKLRMHNTAELTRYAIAHGLTEIERPPENNDHSARALDV